MRDLPTLIPRQTPNPVTAQPTTRPKVPIDNGSAGQLIIESTACSDTAESRKTTIEIAVPVTAVRHPPGIPRIERTDHHVAPATANTAATLISTCTGRRSGYHPSPRKKARPSSATTMRVPSKASAAKKSCPTASATHHRQAAPCSFQPATTHAPPSPR